MRQGGTFAGVALAAESFLQSRETDLEVLGALGLRVFAFLNRGKDTLPQIRRV